MAHHVSNAQPSLTDSREEIVSGILDDIRSGRCGEYNGEAFLTTRDDPFRHVDVYAASFATRSLPLWISHLGWAKSAMIERGAGAEAVECVFQSMRDSVERAVGKHDACEILDLGLQAFDALPSAVDCAIDMHQPYAQVMQQYVDSMLSYDKAAAWAAARAAQLPLDLLYIHVLGPALHRVGLLWQAARITPAQEHYATAATSEFMVEARSASPKNPRGRRVIAACVAGELHDVGVRMVADLFEFHGWISLYLGANVPADAIAATVQDHQPDVVAISVTMTAQLAEAARLLDAVRQCSTTTTLLVGGLPFQLAPDLFRQLGADATAANAHAAVARVNALLAVDGS